MALGFSFSPTDRNEGVNAAPSEALQQAIQILSLHVPKFFGSRAISSPDLLTSPGAQGSPMMNSALIQNLLRGLVPSSPTTGVPGGGPGAPSPAPMPAPGGFKPRVHPQPNIPPTGPLPSREPRERSYGGRSEGFMPGERFSPFSRPVDQVFTRLSPPASSPTGGGFTNGASGPSIEDILSGLLI